MAKREGVKSVYEHCEHRVQQRAPSFASPSSSRSSDDQLNERRNDSVNPIVPASKKLF